MINEIFFTSESLRMLHRSPEFAKWGHDTLVTRTKGTRQGTRSILRKGKRERRRLFIGRSMHPYEEGDKVAIVLDGAQQKGMPHRRFQGRTGVIESSQGRAYVVKVADGNKMKTVIARPEHLKPIE